MVAQYNFKETLHQKKTAIKSAFHFLLLEYGNKGEHNGEYFLDVDQFDFLKMIPCHAIIKSGSEIFFKDYGDTTEDLYPFEVYDIERLADFYDKLAKVMNKKLAEQNQ